MILICDDDDDCDDNDDDDDDAHDDNIYEDHDYEYNDDNYENIIMMIVYLTLLLRDLFLDLLALLTRNVVAILLFNPENDYVKL